MPSKDSSHIPQQELVDFIAHMGGERQLRVEENLGSGFVRLRTSEAERRQAQHDIRHVEDVLVEMLRNARDAHARHVFVAVSKHDSIRTISILDDGDGVPAHLHDAIFDARVTSKLESMVVDHWGVHGRGMALFSIRHTAQSCKLMQSAPHLGSSFKVVCDTNLLSERTDQSTWPSIQSPTQTCDDEEKTAIKGPRNIIRTVVEFCLELEQPIDVFLGSPADICTVLYEYGRKHLDPQKMLFLDNISDLPIPVRLAACVDAKEFIETAALLGLDISERTAHRILAGEQDLILSVMDTVKRRTHRNVDRSSGIDLYADRRGLKISKTDLLQFSHDLEQAFGELASKYYITLAELPIITVSKDRVRVTFKIDKEG